MSNGVRFLMVVTALSLLPIPTFGQKGPPKVSPGTGLRVSADGRNLLWDDDTPLFYLADTGWELFSRTTRDEAVRYLDDRKKKRFTVIQTAFLALQTGPNAYGHKAVTYADLVPLTTPSAEAADPNAYDYWDHVDYVLNEAAARGFYVAVAPFRQQLLPKNRADAERYGRRPNLIWMVGFDASAEHIDSHADTYRALAKGIAEGTSGGVADYDKVFLTFQPAGRHSSSRWFHREAWLRLNMIQSGHGRDTPS